MKPHTFAIHTLGCKLNTYESDSIAGAMKEAGFREVDFTEPADVYIINTCTVTNMADRKSRQMLHRARKLCPDALIVAAGCYVDALSLDAERKGEEPAMPEGIDMAVPNRDKGLLVQRVLERLGEAEPDEAPACGGLFVKELDGHTRAFIKVQDGCDLFCSYCIIPFVRGRSVIRPQAEVLEEVRGLAERGVCEAVLTGINVSALGMGVAEIVEGIEQIPGIRRIRLSSLEPELITEPFVERLAACGKLCPHFHLSLQSGSASVLKRMNRHYTPEQYLKCLELLRSAFVHPAVTTDIIAGFQGETDEEFRETLDFVREAQFYEAHVFKYSMRAGTVAARRKDQVPEEIKKERSAALIRQAALQSHAFRSYYLGKELEFLCEEEILIGGKPHVTGFTKEYVRCVREGSAPVNSLVSGHATEIFKEKNIDEYLFIQ